MGRKATDLSPGYRDTEAGLPGETSTPPKAEIRMAWICENFRTGGAAMSKARLSGHFESKELFCLSCCISLLLASLLLLFPLTAQTVYAAQIRVGWHASPDPDVAGYRIYYGLASRTYSYVVDVGLHTSCVIAGLNAEKDYFFAAKSCNTSGIESDLSEEIAYYHSSATRPGSKGSGSTQSTKGHLIRTSRASENGSGPPKMLKELMNRIQK